MLKYVLALALASPALAQGIPPQNYPMTGGWRSIANPTHNGEVRAAAGAALTRLPGHARLVRIESAENQVVAGMNYHLALRLADNSRWIVTVWHKLDRSYQVTSVKRVS